MTRRARLEKDAAQLDQCYWHKCDDGSMAFIPRCCGGAVYGPEQCTCDVPESQLEAAKRVQRSCHDELERLRDKLRRAADRTAVMSNKERALYGEIRRLRELLSRSGVVDIAQEGFKR